MDDYRWGKLHSYTAQQAKDRQTRKLISELEEKLEDEERRNLRLSKQLLDETSMRARAERSLGDAWKQLSEALLRIDELETGKKRGGQNDV